LRLLLERDAVIEPPGVLLQPARDLPPFPRERLTPLDWSDVDIRRESWGANRERGTVQGRMIERMESDDWEVIIDDDGAGEVADIVALRVIDGTLAIELVHCKYSGADTPGARIDDLYELAGQAQRSAGVRRNIDVLFQRLIRRERARVRRDTTGFVRGTINDLQRLFENSIALSTRLTISLAQPGMSARAASTNQLELLSSVEHYIADTVNSSIQVFCSE